MHQYPHQIGLIVQWSQNTHTFNTLISHEILNDPRKFEEKTLVTCQEMIIVILMTYLTFLVAPCET
jgi:hypothetical protein